MKQLALALGIKPWVLLMAGTIPCTIFVYQAINPITPIMATVMDHDMGKLIDARRDDGVVSIDAMRVWFAKDRAFATKIAAMCPSKISHTWADTNDGHICIAAIELREQSISRDHTMFTGASK